MIKLTEPKGNDCSVLIPESIEEMHYIPGLWLNGKRYWLQNCSEKILYQEEVMVKIKQEHVHSRIRLFHLVVSNHSDQIKLTKLISMHHHPKISQEHFAFISPTDHVVLHLANKDMYMINGFCNGTFINECTLQPYLNIFTDEIWSCREKGKLKYVPMIKGPSASILAMDIAIKPHETVTLSTWIIKGKEKQELVSLDKAIIKNRLAFH